MCVFVCVFICVSLFFFRTGRKLAKTMWNASQKAFFMYFDALLNLARQMFSAQANLMRYLAPLSTHPPAPPWRLLRVMQCIREWYFEAMRFNCVSCCCLSLSCFLLPESVKDPVTECTRDRQNGQRESRERGRERERKREMEKYKEREGNVSSCRGTPWKSPDIAHISHIYKKRSVSTWQTVAEIALSRLANTLLPSCRDTGY